MPAAVVDPSVLVPFALASAILVVIPGPAVAYIVTRAVSQGRSAGVVSAVGIETGALVHVAAAAAGVSAVIASSATAFSVLKYAGAAYLIALGIGRLRSREAGALADLPRASRGRLFRQGVLVNALNPKLAVFFVAFVPQFIDPGRGSVAAQALVLGMFFVAIATVLDCTWALAAGSVGDRLRRSVAVRRRLDRLSGGAFVGLGVVAAFARR
jgi:threonine/homoserine/homoserine lactone efflux protein